MFKFVLAFIVWLFATGNYKAWAALVTTSAAPSTAPVSGSTTSQATNGTSSGQASNATSGNLLGALGALGSGSENAGASSTSTPDDLIGGFTG